MALTDHPVTPMSRLRALLGRAWRDVRSVYYANTPAWRWLKSGALVFFGLFCWSAAGLLHSYRPGWDWLTYAMAYGFLVIVWGPLTHFVVVPASIRLRRTADRPGLRTLARHASKLNLSVFLALVVVLGTVTPGVMLLDFRGALGDGGGSDVSAEIDCTAADDLVRCRVTTEGEVDHVVVTSGGERLRTVEEPPYAFELDRDELATVAGTEQFVVELRDADGDTLRRFVRTAPPE